VSLNYNNYYMLRIDYNNYHMLRINYNNYHMHQTESNNNIELGDEDSTPVRGVPYEPPASFLRVVGGLQSKD